MAEVAQSVSAVRSGFHRPVGQSDPDSASGEVLSQNSRFDLPGFILESVSAGPPRCRFPERKTEMMSKHELIFSF